jgi:hypothetical protein
MDPTGETKPAFELGRDPGFARRETVNIRTGKKTIPPPLPDDAAVVTPTDEAPSTTTTPGAESLPPLASRDEPDAPPADGADGILSRAMGADAATLRKLASEMRRLTLDTQMQALLSRATGRGREADAALEVVASRRGPATVAALVAFPGTLHVDVFGHGVERAGLEDSTSLGRILLRLGPDACALVAAHGAADADHRQSRYVAVLLAAETVHAGVPGILADLVFDVEMRTAIVAAEAWETMRLGHDQRAGPARAAVETLREALKTPSGERRMAAARAAALVHDKELVPLLLDILDEPGRGGLTEIMDGRGRGLADVALEALREITKQDFGTSSRKWRKWWAENGTRPRLEWLVEGLEHKEREVRQSAQRELNRTTREYLGYYADAPKADRDEAVTRWRTWLREAHHKPDLG